MGILIQKMSIMLGRKLGILLCAFLLGIIIPTALSAQVKKGTEVIRMGPESTTRKTSFWSNSMLKTNIVSPLFGIGHIEFEKELTDFFSIQIGGGITFKKTILLNERIKEHFYDLSTSRDLFLEDQFDFSENFNEPHTSTKMGYLFSAAARFFVLGRGYEGFYISPTMEYRHYNFDAASIVPNRSTLLRNTKFRDELYEKNTLLVVRLGQQNTFRWLAIDYYGGLGIMYINKHTQDLARNSQGHYTGNLRTYNFSHFWPELGFKLGFLLY